MYDIFATLPNLRALAVILREMREVAGLHPLTIDEVERGAELEPYVQLSHEPTSGPVTGREHAHYKETTLAISPKAVASIWVPTNRPHPDDARWAQIWKPPNNSHNPATNQSIEGIFTDASKEMRVYAEQATALATAYQDVALQARRLQASAIDEVALVPPTTATDVARPRSIALSLLGNCESTKLASGGFA